MTVFTDFATKVEALAEEGIEKAEAALAQLEITFGPLLKVFEPAQLAILAKAVEDALPLLLTDPPAGWTTLVSDLGAREIAWWHTAQPTLQTAVLEVLTAHVKLGATVAATPAVDTPVPEVAAEVQVDPEPVAAETGASTDPNAPSVSAAAGQAI